MITEQDIRYEAFRIWQIRKRNGDPDADNTEQNWEAAEDRLRECHEALNKKEKKC